MLEIRLGFNARMAELADATDSKSVSPWESGSSTLPPGTKTVSYSGSGIFRHIFSKIDQEVSGHRISLDRVLPVDYSWSPQRWKFVWKSYSPLSLS